MKSTEQRRIRTFVPNERPLRGSFGPKFRNCFAGLLCARGSGAPTKLLLATLATTFATLALTTTPASATIVHVYTSSFGSEGEAAAQFKAPSGVAVNSSTSLTDPDAGDVYVVDKGNNRVEQFSSAGAFIAAWGWGVSDGKAEYEVCATGCQAGIEGAGPGQFDAPEAIAVDNSGNPMDPSADDVYVTNTAENVIEKFEADGTYLGQLTEGSGGAPFSRLDGVAVDPAGSLWVYQASGEIDSFSDALVNAFASARNSQAQFTEEPGFAVDSEDHLYVLHEGSLQYRNVAKLNSAGEAETQRFGGVEEQAGVAVNPANNNVYLDAGATIGEFSSGGSLIERYGEGDLTGGGGLAVNSSTGTVYVADAAGNDVAMFTATLLPEVTTGEATNLETEASATLNGTVNPDGEPVTSCDFEYVQSSEYEPAEANPYAKGASAACESNPGSGTVAVPVKADITGLTPDTVYDYRLVAANANGENNKTGVNQTFTALARPAIGGQSVTDVASTSATLSSSVNPGALATTYTFEYAPASGTFTPVTEAEGSGDLPAGVNAVGVSVHVQHGLLPSTSYEFRVVAHNSIATVTGTTTAFRTQSAGGAFALPDGRQYEMVSPPAKEGAVIEPIDAEGLIQAASDGARFTYLTTSPTESEPRGNGNPTQVLATRGPEGWTDKDLSTPHEYATGTSSGDGYEYRFFASELTQAIVEPEGEFTPITSEETPPGATERTLYLRDDATCQTTPATCYTPLLTAANTPPGTKFGPGRSIGGPNPEGYMPPVEYFGATPDASHVLLRSDIPLTSPPIAGQGEESGALYEWAAGHVQLVSVLPEDEGGQPTANAYFGGYSAGLRGAETRNAISEDGSRVVWTSHEGTEAALYMRDTATEETVRLDLPEPECLAHSTCGGEEAAAHFDMASSDGSTVFFTDTQQLTANSRASTGSGAPEERAPDLYACEMIEVEEAGQKKLKCDLTDLSPDTNPDGEPASVQGAVLGASEDGTYVYFVADGVLADGAEHGAKPGDCENAPASTEAEKQMTTCNLYVAHYNDESKMWEAPKFIATVSGADEPDWQYERLIAHTSLVSGNGRFLAFMSERPLAGYDNRDARSAEPDEEVYLYHAETSPEGTLEPGTLGCASCDPTGAAPVGIEHAHIPLRGPDTSNSGLVGGYQEIWKPTTWLAANVPGWSVYEHARGGTQPHYLSDSGRLFFNSDDALVSKDVNGTWDVYEYEPEGVGGCTSATQGGSSTFKPARAVEVEAHTVEEGAGCVGLISSGTSGEESAFLGASEAGGDVFFLTDSRLVPQDVDSSLDVYDAHECTSASPCAAQPNPAPVACNTEASCRPAPEPQPEIFGPSGSAAFSGPGNLAPPAPAAAKPKPKALTRAQKLASALTACHKKRGKQRANCEKTARKKYSAMTAAKRASHDRGAAR